jgi:hypothetical protein
MSLVKYIVFLLLSIVISQSKGQSVSGSLYLQKGQEIRLEGFNGFNFSFIQKDSIDLNGDFKLNYYKSDYGLVTISSCNNLTSLNLILSAI